MKTIVVKRAGGWYGRFRKLDIIVDGVKMAALSPNKDMQIHVPDEAQYIWGKMDWGQTPAMQIARVPHGGIVMFKGYFTLNPAKNMGADALPFVVSVEGAD